jgi:hypothetical protein
MLDSFAAPPPEAALHVEGAGLHHNPTPGPADQRFVYGHVWVTLAWLAPHPLGGALALPLRALRYVRRQDVAKLPRRYGWPFRTKLELAAELVGWAARWARGLGKALGLACDGADAKRPLLRAARDEGVTVVSRLRKDAALRTVPPPRRKGPRGRPRVYGEGRLSLAKRVGQRRGWQKGAFVLYGAKAVKTYKTFLATWRPAGGVIRVVLVKEERGWLAFFCTDPGATGADILGTVADRFALEQCCHDLKEVWGAGQQQVRNLGACIGAFHLDLWLHTLTALWAWDRPARQLVDRRESPWDEPERRPSPPNHAALPYSHAVSSKYPAYHSRERFWNFSSSRRRSGTATPGGEFRRNAARSIRVAPPPPNHPAQQPRGHR